MTHVQHPDRPERWGHMSDEVRALYLSSKMTRTELIHEVAELAGIPKEDVGVSSLTSAGLAKLVVRLEVQD